MSEAPAHGADARPRVVAGLRLLARVGSGGEGEVWEARDADGSLRALKLIRPEVLPAPAEMARRGAYLRRIDHPALVRVHRTGRLQGSSLEGWGFLEMEFVDGEPLGQAPADPSALDRLEPLAEGLDKLHQGEWSDGVPLVHRDVKPANLIARPDGSVVLVDCSTLRGTDATHITRVGTPVFAAPEVMSGTAGPPADVYSFGATIVALVTGARGEELARLLAETERLEIPDAVRRALQPDPAARPRSCRAVLDAGAEIDLDLLPPLPSGHDWTLIDDSPAETAPAPQGYPSPEAVGPYGPEVPPVDAAAGLLPAAPRPLAGRALALLACGGLAWAATSGRDVAARALATAGLDLAPAVWVPAAALAAIALHLIVTRLAGQPLAVAVALPSAAWAWLLGERASVPGVRRAWARATLTGLLSAAVVVIVAWAAGADAALVDALADVPVPRRALVPALLAASLLAAGAARGRGVTAFATRLLLAPAWALGAALLLVAGCVTALAAAPAGRARAGIGLVAGTLAGSGAFVGMWGVPRDRQAPDPRA